MIKIILVILIYLPFSYFSQILTKKQESAIKNTIASQFGEQFAKNINLNLGSTNFQNLAGDTLFNPDGLNYVFKLTSDTLLRLDQSIFHGADNNRFLFTYNNKLYALGGYGHFTTNNNLKQFNFTNHEWQFVSCQGETPPFILGPAYIHGKYLYSFNNFKSGNNIVKDQFDTNTYRLNLETKQWQRVYNNLLIKHNIERRSIYYTNDYLMLYFNLNSLLINVKLNAIITINNEENGFGLANVLKRINGDSLFFEPFIEQKGKEVILDLNQIWQSHAKQSKAINWELQLAQEPHNPYKKMLLASIVFSIVLVILLVLLLKKNKSILQLTLKQNNSEPDLDETVKDVDQIIENNIQKKVVEIFLNSQKTELSVEELDELLEISHLTDDSRRLRRHRMLIEFPEGFITRTKSNADKRSFIYKLNLDLLKEIQKKK
jgi:hypothetical protein